MNILIVEDNDDARLILKKFLESNRHHVEEASNGSEALIMARINKPDMIVSDILMPVMDGFVLCREVRQDETLCDVPFVFCTATYTDEEDEKFALELGADRFIRKPMDGPQFLAAIEGVAREVATSRLMPSDPGMENGDAFLKIYNERIIQKLEKKMNDLEIANQELKTAEVEAVRMALEWQATFDAANDAIWILDQEQKVLRSNKTAERFFHFPYKDMIGKHCWEIVHGTAQPIPECPILRARKNLRRETMELRIGEGWFQVIVDPIMDEAGQYAGAVHIVSDITDRKRREDELLKADKLESLGILAGGIAHDFNNILTSISGNISLAKIQVNSGDDIFDLLSAAETASVRAQGLTGQLLTFAKGGTPIKETVSIQKLIKESSIFVLRGSKSGCKFKIAEDLWPVDADVGQISQVISNIVINANQAMPEGGIIKIAAENLMPEKTGKIPISQGRNIRISIKDQGIGIAEKYLPKIFDPYFTTKQAGSGLGLATSYSIIKKHNGHISVVSLPGTGTTFDIYLPASDNRIQVKQEKAVLLTGRGKILVMDDDELLKQVAKKMLGKLGYESEFAKDGDEAIEMYKKAMESGKPYDTVFLDLTISGGMGGTEAVKILLKMDPEVKAIVCSGYSGDEVISNFREYGFKGMMPKPFGLHALGKVLNDVLKDNKLVKKT